MILPRKRLVQDYILSPPSLSMKKLKRSPCLTDLPTDICLNNLLKVSAKSIIACKCVCKAWNDLISYPAFVNRYSAQKKTCLLIKDMYSTRFSRTLYSIEPEDCHSFFIEHYRCDKLNCNRCRLNVSLKNKLKIPLANVDDMLNSAQHDPNVIFYHKNVNNIMSLIKVKQEDHKNVNNIMLNGAQHDPNVIFYHKNVSNIMSLIKVKPEDHRYNVVNSCNGLLCLVKQASDPSWFNSVAVVCNPITGEFLCCGGIRRKNNYDYRHSVTCGLGFHTKNSLHKIIQMCIQWTQNPAWGFAVFAQIKSAYAYTMGVSCWRNLKTKINYVISEWKNVASPAPITPLKPHSPTYFCGALHWVFADKSNDLNCKVLSLDLDEEQFHFHGVRLSPPWRLVRSGKAIIWPWEY